MRIFASERVAGLMQKLGMQEGEAIEHPWVTKAIENAQRKVEGRNFDIRKQLLEFDNVANDQRKHVYEQRRELMEADDVSENIQGIRHDVVNEIVDGFIPPQSYHESWRIKELVDTLQADFGHPVPVDEWIQQNENLTEEEIRQRVLTTIEAAYKGKEDQVGTEVMRQFERAVMLQVLDGHWKEHLSAMDHLRQGIHLRGYAQKDPKQEYKREAFDMFAKMLQSLMRDVIGILSKVEVRAREDVEALEAQRRREAEVKRLEIHETADALQGEESLPEQASGQVPVVRRGAKVGRNDPCPCGSGRKYKQCHGKLS